MSPRWQPYSPVRDPLTVTPRWIGDYRMVWGRSACCCLCGRPITIGEQVRWGSSGDPRTIRHLACERRTR